MTLSNIVAVVDAPLLEIIVKVMVYPSRAKVDVSSVKVLHPWELSGVPRQSGCVTCALIDVTW